MSPADHHGTFSQVKKGAHLKNFVSMIDVDTMAIGASDTARNLLRVRTGRMC